MMDEQLIKRLEAKEQVCGLRPELKGLIDDTCYKYNIKVKTYHEEIVEIIRTLDKYNQALLDIKEIANYSFNLSTSELLAKLEQILQKSANVR